MSDIERPGILPCQSIEALISTGSISSEDAFDTDQVQPASLDLRLFERGGRVLKLTEEGRALYERTAALLTDLEETATAIASGGHRFRATRRRNSPTRIKKQPSP